MREIILEGKVVPGQGYGDATKRMKQLEDIFSQKILNFSDFVKAGGTLNIELDPSIHYPKKTIRGNRIIRFEPEEVAKTKNPPPQGKNYPREGFTFIPVFAIQGEPTEDFIYSPDETCNPDNVIEVIAKFNIREEYKLTNGDRISITTLINEKNI
jgi:CTP-dependent riboflavin kinase